MVVHFENMLSCPLNHFLIDCRWQESSQSVQEMDRIWTLFFFHFCFLVPTVDPRALNIQGKHYCLQSQPVTYHLKIIMSKPLENRPERHGTQWYYRRSSTVISTEVKGFFTAAEENSRVSH